MEKPTKIVMDCSTGIQEIIELTDGEIAQLQADRANWEADRLASEAEAEAKANAKASAHAKLKALGLTEDEVTALI